MRTSSLLMFSANASSSDGVSAGGISCGCSWSFARAGPTEEQDATKVVNNTKRRGRFGTRAGVVGTGFAPTHSLTRIFYVGEI